MVLLLVGNGPEDVVGYFLNGLQELGLPRVASFDASQELPEIYVIRDGHRHLETNGSSFRPDLSRATSTLRS